MNTVPTARELPPRRHAEIRAELERVAWEGPARSRLVPVATAAAAVVVLGATATLTLDRDDPTDRPAGRTDQTGRATETVENTDAGPVFPALTEQQVREITEGCLWITGLGRPNGTLPVATTNPPVDDVLLYNVLDDDAGRFAFLYGDKVLLDCTVGGPAGPYNSGFAGRVSAEDLTGPIAVDLTSGSGGGDVPGNKEIYRGQLGTEVTAGRVRADVARVTMTVGDETVDAALANGTFVARLVHPSTWEVPNVPLPTRVRAYDADGALLAEVDPYVARPR